MENRTNKTVPLGSGRFYIVEHDGSALSAEKIVSACLAENQFGETKGGATLSYTATEHKEKDDHGVLTRVIVTEEEAKLKGGIFSWMPEMLTKLVRTGRVSDEDKYRVVKIGGLNNDDGKQYIVVFKHIDPKYPPLYVAIVGTNSAGLQIAFARDNTSKLEPEFTALPGDEEGTLIFIVEEKVPEGKKVSEGEKVSEGVDQVPA